MYKHKWSNWSNLGEVTVKDYQKNTTTYPDLMSAVANIRSVAGYWAPIQIKYGYLRTELFPNSPNLSGYMTQGDTHILLTSEGVVIPVWKVEEAFNNLPPKKIRYYRSRGNFKFRQGPVEGIHCWKAGRYRGYRRIHTHPELRENDFLDNYDEEAIEYNIKVRGRRKRHNLPTSWDDIRCHSYYKKSWKEYRDHQWKE